MAVFAAPPCFAIGVEQDGGWGEGRKRTDVRCTGGVRCGLGGEEKVPVGQFGATCLLVVVVGDSCGWCWWWCCWTACCRAPIGDGAGGRDEPASSGGILPLSPLCCLPYSLGLSLLSVLPQRPRLSGATAKYVGCDARVSRPRRRSRSDTGPLFRSLSTL